MAHHMGSQALIWRFYYFPNLNPSTSNVWSDLSAEFVFADKSAVVTISWTIRLMFDLVSIHLSAHFGTLPLQATLQEDHNQQEYTTNDILPE